MNMFGYGPALSEAGDIAWGARGIDDGQTIGFLGDRQCWFLRGEALVFPLGDSDKAALNAFRVLMNGILNDQIQPAFAEAKNGYRLNADGTNPTVLYENWFMKATVNPSYGYVHTTIATKQLPDLPIRFELTDEDRDQDPATYKAPTDYLVWSNKDRPDIGSRVELDGGRGDGTVIAWAPEAGHLHMIVWLDSPVESWMGAESSRLTNAMGREWKPVSQETPGVL
jgi:hypothetical protein